MQTSHRVCGNLCANSSQCGAIPALAARHNRICRQISCDRTRIGPCVGRPQRLPPRNEHRRAATNAQTHDDGVANLQYLSDEEVDDLISDAAGFVSVLDELRPLDAASYNPFYEVWTRIARIPLEERHRLLDELEPGSLRSLWRATMSRYLLDESRSLELFAGASVWDDFPSRPGQVYTYVGRCERYDVATGGVTLERLNGGAMSPYRGGGDAASVPATPWLRPSVAGWELQTDRFKQLFFVPPEGCAAAADPAAAAAGPAAAANDGGGDDGGGGDASAMYGELELEPTPPRIYSRVVLPLAGPMDRWWEPLYSRLRVQLALTPLSRDAGADLQLLYPSDPAAAAPQDDGGDEPPEVPYSSPGRDAANAAAAGDEDGPAGQWALLGRDCLPSPPAGGWWQWPEPEPGVYGMSPFSGGPRDFMRVAGPGVYVGCAYRQGPGAGEYREENFVYFVIARRA